MRRVLSILVALCAFGVGSFGQQADRDALLRSLVEAERAFAKLSIEKGIRTSFVENLADDAILYRPGPVLGKKWMEEHKAPTGVLSWQPVFADVALAGDMGYTTGPWEFRPKSLEDEPVAYGNFVTVWKRQADGVWKVAVDLGTSNPPPSLPVPEVHVPTNSQFSRKVKVRTDLNAERSTLLKTDSDFSKLMAKNRTTDAFLSYLSKEVRVFRMNAFPAVGREAAGAMMAAKTGTLTSQPMKADVSRSGDLGYTLGTYKFADGNTEENGNYVRIWKREKSGKFRVVLDIVNPISPAR